MTMPDDGGLHAMVGQVLSKQGEQGEQLAVIIERLKSLPDHENRLRSLELSAAADKGAGRVKAALGVGAAGVISAGAALWVAIANAH